MRCTESPGVSDGNSVGFVWFGDFVTSCGGTASVPVIESEKQEEEAFCLVSFLAAFISISIFRRLDAM